MAYETEPQRTDGAETQAPPSGELGGLDPKELVQAAADFARENPHAAVGAALAIGFLLGGGLTPRLLASVAMFAGRRYLARAASEALEGAVGRQIEDALEGSAR